MSRMNVTVLKNNGTGPVYSDIRDPAYEELAMAIVEKACDDYRKVLANLLAGPDTKKRQTLYGMKAELEDFFFSDWYEQLTDIDPDRLVRRLKELTVADERRKAEERIKRLMGKQEDRLKKGKV